jgi:hypothetical protein
MSAFDPKRTSRTPAAIIQPDKERPIPERRLKDWEHQTSIAASFATIRANRVKLNYRCPGPVSAMD